MRAKRIEGIKRGWRKSKRFRGTVVRKCKECGKQYEIPARLSRKFCSLDCRYKHREALRGRSGRWEAPNRPSMYDPEVERLRGLKASSTLKRTWHYFKEKHNEQVFKKMGELNSMGMRCIPLHRKPHPDLIAVDFNKRKVFAVEVECGKKTPNYSKYSSTTIYDDVIWVEVREDA